MVDIREQLREQIMRHIYDDQREELYDALKELIQVSPLDYIALHEAQAKLLMAAKRQRG